MNLKKEIKAVFATLQNWCTKVIFLETSDTLTVKGAIPQHKTGKTCILSKTYQL